MSNPSKLKEIYAELRRSLGNDISAGDVLRFAAYLLKTYISEPDLLIGFGRTRDSRTFFALPVDEAMKDGGWQILEFEERRNFGIENVDPEEMAVLSLHIQRWLGPEWLQRTHGD